MLHQKEILLTKSKSLDNNYHINLKIKDLADLAVRESQVVEWKENVADVGKVIETIVAFSNDFLNLGGGYVVCGAKEVKDEFGFPTVEYVGLTAARLEEVKKEVMNTCYNPTKVNPPIIPKVDEIAIPNDNTRKILVFTIDSTSHAHTFKTGKGEHYRPRYFVRIDSNTRGATNGIQRELLRRKGQLEPWDRRLNRQATAEAIDLITLRQYLRDMGVWNKDRSIDDYFSPDRKIDEFTPSLFGRSGINNPPYPRNFALLVFGKDPLRWVVGAYSIFAVFKGTDRGSTTAKSQWIKGSIIEQTQTILQLLERENPTEIDKSKTVQNQPKYPMVALREAVVNAIVHRDYEMDQPVRITIFKDRVEVYSPGGLPFLIQAENFTLGRVGAAWRNQSLGRIFSLLDFAQHLGSGITKMIEAMQRAGNPAPVFEVDDFSVNCILYAHPRHLNE